jgi:hypothetical protein
MRSLRRNQCVLAAFPRVGCEYGIGASGTEEFLWHIQILLRRIGSRTIQISRRGVAEPGRWEELAFRVPAGEVVAVAGVEVAVLRVLRPVPQVPPLLVSRRTIRPIILRTIRRPLHRPRRPLHRLGRNRLRRVVRVLRAAVQIRIHSSRFDIPTEGSRSSVGI